MKKYIIIMIYLLGYQVLVASPYTDIVDECKQQDMHGCYELGKHFLLRGEPRKAIYYHSIACNNQYMKSCIKLGVMYQYGKGIKKDIYQATKYYKKACGSIEGSGCSMLGELELNRPKGSIVQALLYFDKGCKQRDANSCTKYAYYHQSNTYTQQNLPLAMNAYRQACRLDKVECVTLADIYNKGQLGVKVNFTKARRYYSQACNGGSSIGCYRVGNLYYQGKGVKQNYKKAKTYYEKSCNGNMLNGTERGCNNLAVLYYYGRGTKRDIAKAKTYYHKACNKGYITACQTLEALKN